MLEFIWNILTVILVIIAILAIIGFLFKDDIQARLYRWSLSEDLSTEIGMVLILRKIRDRLDAIDKRLIDKVKKFDPMVYPGVIRNIIYDEVVEPKIKEMFPYNTDLKLEKLSEDINSKECQEFLSRIYKSVDKFTDKQIIQMVVEHRKKEKEAIRKILKN